MGHGLHGTAVCPVDLHAFQDLEAGAAILAGNHIRAAAGLTLVLYHAAHADGAVELGAQHLHAFLLRMGQRHLHAELLVQEVLDLVAQLHGRGLVQFAQIVKNLVPQFQGHAHEHLLVFGRNGQQLLMRHIVDVLDAHQFLFHLVQVVDEGAVTGRTKEQGAIGLTERFVVRVHGDGIRGFVLEGETDVVFDAVAFLVHGLDFRNGSLEEFLVLRRDGDGEVAGAVCVAHVLLGLYQVLRDGGTDFLRVAVELKDALGFGAVGQAVFLEEFAEDVLAVSGAVLRLAEEFRRIEGEVLDAGGELGAGGIGLQIFSLFQRSQAAEHVLEHAGGGTGGGYEFALAGNIGLLIIGDGILDGLGIQHHDAAFRRGGTDDFHPRETAFEVFYLLFDLTQAGAAFLNLLGVFLVKHSVMWFDIKFLPVGVFAAQLLKAGGIAPEEEIVRKNGVIVLQDGGYFPLRFSVQVYLYRLQGFVFQGRAEVIERLDAKMPGNGLYGHGGAVLLALVGVTGNVRRGNVAGVYEDGIGRGLVTPGVQHQRSQFGPVPQEGALVHNLSAGGVDKEGAGLDFLKEVFRGHAARGGIQRNVQGDHIGPGQQLIQRNKALRAFFPGTGRVVQKNLEAQVPGHLLHFFTHISYANDANDLPFQLDGPAGSHAKQGGKHIVCHTAGIAALCVLHIDAVLGAPVQVDMVCADGGAGNHLHLGALEGFFIAFGTGADNEGVCIQHGVMVDGTTVQVFHLGVGFQNTF